MNAATIAALVLAALAMLGSIGSTLLLSFRVGALVGKITSFMESVPTAISQLWSEIGTIKASQERHVEIFHGTIRGGNHDR